MVEESIFESMDTRHTIVTSVVLQSLKLNFHLRWLKKNILRPLPYFSSASFSNRSIESFHSVECNIQMRNEISPRFILWRGNLVIYIVLISKCLFSTHNFVHRRGLFPKQAITAPPAISRHLLMNQFDHQARLVHKWLTVVFFTTPCDGATVKWGDHLTIVTMTACEMAFLSCVIVVLFSKFLKDIAPRACEQKVRQNYKTLLANRTC